MTGLSVYLFERCTTLNDTVTPLAESSAFDNSSTKCQKFMIIT